MPEQNKTKQAQLSSSKFWKKKLAFKVWILLLGSSFTKLQLHTIHCALIYFSGRKTRQTYRWGRDNGHIQALPPCLSKELDRLQCSKLPKRFISVKETRTSHNKECFCHHPRRLTHILPQCLPKICYSNILLVPRKLQKFCTRQTSLKYSWQALKYLQ